MTQAYQKIFSNLASSLHLHEIWIFLYINVNIERCCTDIVDVLHLYYVLPAECPIRRTALSALRQESR